MTGSAGPPGGSNWIPGQSASQALASKPLLTSAQAAHFIKQMIVPTATGNLILTSTGSDPTPAVYDEEYEVKRTIRYHSPGYYYILSVSDMDEAFFQVLTGNKLAWWVHKTFGKRPYGACALTDKWETVRKRTHLPATLGAALKDIDVVIEDHKASLEHDSYVAELLKTEPDNLKMIGDLEKLQEGEPEIDNGERDNGKQYNHTVSYSGLSLAKTTTSVTNLVA